MRCRRTIVFLLSCVFAGSLAAKPVKDFNAFLAFAPHVKIGGVAPVVVEFETTQAVKGVLELEAAKRLVRRQVDVGKGKFHYEIPVPVLPDIRGITVHLRAGKENVEKRVDLVVIPTGDNLLGWVGLGLQPDPIPIRSHGEPRRIVFSRVPPLKLPTDWRMYEGLDVLLLGRYPSKLSAAQANAITQWCRLGGRVIGGPEAPLEVYATSELSQRISWPGVNPKGGQLFNTAPFGLGVVGTSGERLTRMQLEGLIEKRFPEFISAGILQSTGSPNDTSGPCWSRLNNDCSVPRISLSAVAVYVLILFVLVCLVEPYVLQRIGRMHWTWVVTPVLVVLFCYGADYISFIVRGVHSKHATMVFHDFDKDGNCRRTVAMAFTPSTSGRYRFRSPPRTMLILGHDTDWSWDFEEQCTFSSPVWQTRLMMCVAPAEQKSPVTSDLRRDGRVLRGEVKLDARVVGNICVIHRGLSYMFVDGCWKSTNGVADSACNFGFRWSRAPLIPDDYAWVVVRVAEGDTTTIDCLRKERHYYYIRQVVPVRTGGLE